MTQDSVIYQFGAFRLDVKTRTLYRDGQRVGLAPKVVDTLVILVVNAGEVVYKDRIFREVWPDTHVVESSLTRNISVLRKALDPPEGESCIENISKRGYRFRPAVEVFEPPKATLEPPRTPRMWLAAAALAVAVIPLAIWALSDSRKSTLPADGPKAEAHRQYLIARHHWNRLERGNLLKALKHFERAVELDPDSALGHAGIADATLVMGGLAMGDPAVLVSRARAAADRAIALDPKLAMPRVSATVCAILDFDLPRARRELETAQRLDPGMAHVQWATGLLLSTLGDYSGARTALARAREIDPVSPLIGFTAAQNEYFAERFETAFELLNEVLDREPDFPLAHYYRGLTLAYLGRFEEAIGDLRRSRLNPHMLETDEVWVAAIAGNHEPAETLVRQRLKLVAGGKETPVSLTLPAISARNYDLALKSLEAMAKLRVREMVNIRTDPRFGPIRAHPRFQAVVQQFFGN